MKYLQGKYMTGFVTLIVSGNHPELFLQQLVNEKIYVWEIKKINAHCCQAYVRRFDKKNILSIAQRSSYEITFENDHGLPRVINYFKQQKEIVIASLISVIVFICLSQVIWSIEISGVSQEIEVKINDHLKNNGIKRGAIKPLLDNPSTMQQQLLLDIPELLWVGVEQKGTTL
ncbi:MAG TPA: sporulation protein YqfD, partial [Bacillota bacterium]|nr:sporulation protein YqfD [Bacillota bacterium]